MTQMANERLTAFWREDAFIAEARAYRKSLAPGGTLLCFAGRFDAQSGLSYLIEALRQLPQVRAVFAGHGDRRDEVERLIEAAGIEHRIAVVDGSAERAVWRVLLASDFVVLPLLKPSETGWSVMMKAELCGRRVIASDACAEGQRVFGSVVEAGDVKALTSAIERMAGGAAAPEKLKTEMLKS
jgi:glycosyltransferase involved in cell wall biosynthesis